MHKPTYEPTHRELEHNLGNGQPVSPDELAGFAYRGVSLGLGRVLDRLLWKTFAKVMVSHGQQVRGFNLRIDQTQRDAYSPRTRKPRFGEFVAVRDGDATVLDYGAANPRWHPLSPMRDHLVATSKDRFLGRAYFAIGPRRLMTPSYFTLERTAELAADATLETAHLRLEI